MDHRDLVAQLPANMRRDLCSQSDAPGLLHLGLHAGMILILAICVVLRGPFWAIALLPLGILITFLFTALHECIHRTAFRSDFLNDWVARVAGFLIFLPPVYFRYFHMGHHRFTHDIEKDPELETGKPGSIGALLIYLTGLPEFIARPRVILKNAVSLNDASWIPSRGRRKVLREARIYIAGYALLLILSAVFANPFLLWIWILPLLIGGPFLRGYLLAEHGLCPHVTNMLENTRTTFTTRIVRFIAWNMPYHAEHHAYPAVPFHKLPAFHAVAKMHLKQTERGYTRFNARYMSAPDAPHNKRP